MLETGCRISTDIPSGIRHPASDIHAEMGFPFHFDQQKASSISTPEVYSLYKKSTHLLLMRSNLRASHSTHSASSAFLAKRAVRIKAGTTSQTVRLRN